MIKGSSSLLKVTLSGSYRKDSEGLARDYRELARNQCQVLSPRSLDFEDPSSSFVRHQSERDASIHVIEKFHLQAIELSDFLWVHAPNGYIGVSTAMEIGYALAKQIPIFCAEEPEDQIFKSFITKVPSVFAAIEQTNN